MRLLGIDYGESKIGLAIGETDAHLASPFVVIKNDDATMDLLKKYVKDEDIQKIIIGIPYGDVYTNTLQSAEVEKFVWKLEDTFPIPVEKTDERYSTAEAQRLQLDDEIKGEDDAIAAMLILQSYMDKMEKES